MTPVAYFGLWIERTALNVVIFFAIFVAIFAFSWLLQYAIWKNKIKALNRRAKERE